MTAVEHPMQPVYRDSDGVIRFKQNKIVRFLVDWARPRGMSLNDLAMLPFDDEDRAQLAQLIGYSVSGFSELSYMSDELVERADAMVEEIPE
jgi:hypothetical protein